MTPLRVRVKGFLSYHDETVFNFEGKQLWMLAGPNGAGKSAVFDAITLAMYGRHRGGKSGDVNLINKRADSFLVEYDFAMGNQRYRILRTQSRKGSKATRVAYRLVDNVPSPIADTDSEGGFNRWIAEEFRLNSAAFEASVLLRQGKNGLLDCEAPERHKMLSQVVDLSRYETLQIRCDEVAKRNKNLADVIQIEIDRLGDVDEALIPTFKGELDRTEVSVADRDRQIEVLNQQLVMAQLWKSKSDQLSKERADASAALSLIEQAEDIRRQAARLSELQSVIPALTDAVDCRRRLMDNETRTQVLVDKFRNDAPAIIERYSLQCDGRKVSGVVAALEVAITGFESAEKSAPWLRKYAQERTQFNGSVDQVASRCAAIAEIEAQAPPDLVGAQADLEQAEKALRDSQASLEVARSNQLQASERLSRLNEVGGEPSCRYCGQTLTPDHIEAERQRLDRELADADEKVSQTESTHRTAGDQRKQAAVAAKDSERKLEARNERLRQLRQEQDRAVAESNRAVQSASQAVVNITEPFASRLVSPQNTSSWKASSYPTENDINEVDGYSRLLSPSRADLNTVRKLDADNSLLKTGHDEIVTGLAAFTARIPDLWKPVGATLDDIGLRKLIAEHAGLDGSNQMLVNLESAQNEQVVRQERITNLQSEIETIPAEARRLTSEVETALGVARNERKEAQSQVQRLQTSLTDLLTRKEQIAKKKIERTEKSKLAGLYAELSKYLGREYLQRHLLSQAESAIVEYANAALAEISHGSLRLQLSSEKADGRTAAKALDVLCYNVETSSEPLPLDNLSGSQRFRVAVSFALAIGQFASRNDARIKSVIIDEGFGSLDLRGQNEMIRELKQLTTQLDRIIVVSHQESFADSFDDRYDISINDDGSSTATRRAF